MYTAAWLISSLFALTATASPIAQRDSQDTFNIEVCNQCSSTKSFGLYKIDGSFQMSEMSKTVTIPSNGTQTIQAPYKETGMRLSGNADWGSAGQWKPQALFEFGYSEFSGQSGTAYDLSLMDGCDKDIGLAAYPDTDSEECPSKMCHPGNCDFGQGWTNPDQIKDGSPADTVCYKGKVNFKVVFCP